MTIFWKYYESIWVWISSMIFSLSHVQDCPSNYTYLLFMKEMAPRYFTGYMHFLLNSNSEKGGQIHISHPKLSESSLHFRISREYVTVCLIEIIILSPKSHFSIIFSLFLMFHIFGLTSILGSQYISQITQGTMWIQ